MLLNPDTLRPGTFLQGDKYRIIRYINAGGFGCTYEAEHTLMRARVAIKEFFVSDICNRDGATGHVSVGVTSKRGMFDKLRGKFLDEARGVFHLNHSGIVHVSDVFEENGTAYFVMDYIDGCSLADMVKKYGPMDERTALAYMRQVCAALDYVHAHSRLHLDIKPGNIMVDRNGRAILIDFGASKQYDTGTGENGSTLLGYTPGFAPPEQMTADVKKFLPATDVYALGATLYNLLTGEAPLDATLRSSGESNAPLPATVSAGTRRAVEEALRLNKQERTQSVMKFAAMLFPTNAPRPQPQPKPAPTPQPKPVKPDDETRRLGKPFGVPVPAQPWYRRTGIIIALATVIVIGAVIAILRGSSDSADDYQDTASQIVTELDDEPATIYGEVFTVDSAPAAAEPTPQPTQPVANRQETPAPTPTIGSYNGHEYVDLGLSVKWATYNVGASSPTGDGYYYAWGETRPKSEYLESNSDTYGKNMGSISGNAAYDAARANWGSPWRLPTADEIDELVKKCDWQWTGSGYRVTSKSNGNSIYLPAAGWRNGSSLYSRGSDGSYWSGTPHESNSNNAYRLFFVSGSLYRGWNGRRRGYSVRPVAE